MKPSSAVLQTNNGEGKKCLTEEHGGRKSQLFHTCVINYIKTNKAEWNMPFVGCLFLKTKTKDCFLIDRMPQCIHIRFLSSHKGHIKNRTNEAVT